jgi:opine dehydrogenase
MSKFNKFCVIGAGNGGLAMAGHLAIMGVDVALWNRSEERISDIKQRGVIEVTGAVKGFGKIRLATTDIGEAVSEADVIMVVIPATGHADVAKVVAPYLNSGQIVILNPGRTGGAFEFANTLQKSGVVENVIVAETQTFIYASRAITPCKVMIKGIKNCVPLASLPAYYTPKVLEIITPVYPQFIPGDSVLSTSFDNIGAIFHPALLLFNASRVEQNQKFDYYIDGATPSVVHILEAMDKERVAVATALGVRTHTAREWLYIAYDAVGKTLFEALQGNSAYEGILAPESINHRYITEEIPTSLVPINSIGDMLGVPTPTIDSIIHLASVVHGTEYKSQGRTVEKLGIDGLSVMEIRRLALEGIRFPRIIKSAKYNIEPHMNINRIYQLPQNDRQIAEN